MIEITTIKGDKYSYDETNQRIQAIKDFKCFKGAHLEDIYEFNKRKNIYVEYRNIFKTLKHQAHKTGRKNAPEVIEYEKKVKEFEEAQSLLHKKTQLKRPYEEVLKQKTTRPKKPIGIEAPDKPGKIALKTFGSFASRWALIQTASIVGDQLKDTDIPEAKKAPLISEQERWQTKAQEKANALLSAGGIATTTVGIVLQTGSKTGAKFAWYYLFELFYLFCVFKNPA